MRIFAVAELAVAAGLLLAALSVGLASDGFAIGNLGSFESDFGVVALFEARDDGLDVRLACAGDEELVGLRIAEEADEEMSFFHQFMDGRRELVASSARDLGSMA